MTRVLLALLLSLLPAVGWAQETATAQQALDYDLDSDTDVYPLLTGIGDNPFASPNPALGCTVTTSGSSTQLDAWATTCFVSNPLAADDVLVFNLATGSTYRVFASVTDGDTLVLSEAINIAAAASFGYKKASAGAAATSGWVGVGNAAQVTMCFEYNQGDLATGVDVRFECISGAMGANPVQVYPDNSAGVAVMTNTTANVGLNARTCVVIDTGAWSACRTARTGTGQTPRTRRPTGKKYPPI